MAGGRQEHRERRGLCTFIPFPDIAGGFPCPQPTPRKRPTRPRIGGDAPQVMTAEEYVTLPDRQNGCAYELVRGLLVVRDPGVSWTHSYVQGKLQEPLSVMTRVKATPRVRKYRYLDEWMEKFGHGEVGVEVAKRLYNPPRTASIAPSTRFHVSWFSSTALGNMHPSQQMCRMPPRSSP